MKAAYRRILVKLSGERLAGEGGFVALVPSPVERFAAIAVLLEVGAPTDADLHAAACAHFAGKVAADVGNPRANVKAGVVFVVEPALSGCALLKDTAEIIVTLKAEIG